MPELADVEGFRRVIERVAGSEIQRVEVLDPGVVRQGSARRLNSTMRGRRVRPAVRTGKWLVVPTDGPSLIFHFGMTGSLQWTADASERHPYDRVVFITDHGELRYRDQRKLQGVYLAKDARAIGDIVGQIGPDALDITETDFRAHLQPKRSTIKSALIDQRRLAGLGNMLSDEILWRACIHPATEVKEVSDSEWHALHRASQEVLHTAVRAGHTPRGPNWLTGVRWDPDARCPRCGTFLERSKLAGRTTVWCPDCQTRPRSARRTTR